MLAECLPITISACTKCCRMSPGLAIFVPLGGVAQYQNPNGLDGHLNIPEWFVHLGLGGVNGKGLWVSGKVYHGGGKWRCCL